MAYCTENSNWLTAVMENDVEAVRSQLAHSDEETIHLLLEGWLCDGLFMDCLPRSEVRSQKIMSVHRLLGHAAVSGSCDVIVELHSAGMDMFQMDNKGNNVIHTLIIHANRNQECETMYLDVFNQIALLMTDTAFNRLLTTENSSVVKPLELAIYLQTFRLLNAILTAPGLYLRMQALWGTLTVDYFDVTEYECDATCRPLINSPMFLLSYLRSGRLEDDYTTKVITRGLIRQWLNIRKNVYLPFIIFWAVLRLLCVILAFFPAELSDPPSPNIRVCGTYIPTPQSAKYFAIITLSVLTILALAIDAYDTVKFNTIDMQWMKAYSPIKGQTLLQYSSYRVGEFVYNLCILILCLNKVSLYFWGHQLPVYPAQVLFANAAIGGVWSLLFFVQLMPVIGTYVMATLHMLHSLFEFGAIILIFVLPFTFIFPKFISERTDGTCPEEFNGIISSMYSRFTVLLNMIDFRSFDAPSKESLWLLHVFYIVFVAILLLNFLIAIFSDSYTMVANHSEIISDIQWLSVMATVEFRIPSCMRFIVNRLKRRYYFCHENRIYVRDFRSFRSRFIEKSKRQRSADTWVLLQTWLFQMCIYV